MRKRLALVLLSWFVCIAARAQQPALTVGTATTIAGQTVVGFIEVPAGSDAGTSLPVVVIRVSSLDRRLPWWPGPMALSTRPSSCSKS
jgi:hypothetical protein